MDHLLLPANPISGYPRIPFICEEIEDCDDFLELSQIYAKKWRVTAQTAQSGGTLWLSQAQSHFGVVAVEAFLQRWIFFGLLREALSPLDLFDASHYLENEGQRGFVHTKSLRDVAQRWTTSVEDWDAGQKTVLGDRLFDCLTVATRSLRGFYDSVTHADLDYNVTISLFTIIETISGLADTHLLLSSAGINNFPRTLNPTILTDHTTAQMLGAGWCRSEIMAVQRTSSSVTTQLFLHQMQRPLKIDHTNCGENQCKKLQVQSLDDAGHTIMDRSITYTPAHVDPSCECALLGPDPVEIAECLKNHTFPLLCGPDQDANGTLLDVVPYRQDLPYVAVSHLWVDGLGNPDSTRLPTCQARRLYSLLAKLRGMTFQYGTESERRTEERKFLLWCDTYCCPTEEEDVEGQRLALSKLREVYEKAAYVLVLDQELGMMNHTDLSPLERAARLGTSRWAKRLWTFQECVLSTKLLINFADKIVDFRDLMDDLRAYYRNNPIDQFITLNVYHACYQMRAWLASDTSGGTRRDQIFRLSFAIHGRGISKATDEPLCLATALDLDLEAVAQTSPAQRMQTFWALASCSEGGFPPGIIFNRYPRLSAEGYRWAPASLLGGNPEAHDRYASKSICTPYGLSVKLPGWKVGLKPSILQSYLTIEHTTVALRTTSGHWYHIGPPEGIRGDAGETIIPLLQDDSKHWYIIFDADSSQPSDKVCKGLLAYSEQHSDQTVFRSLAVVSIHRVADIRRKSHQVVSERVTLIQQHLITRRLRQWSNCERLFERIIDSTPTTFHRVLRSTSRWALRLAFGNIRVRFDDLIDREALEASKSPDGIEVKDRLFNPRVSPPWKQSILRDLTQRTPFILEYFDPDSEWCID